MQSQESLRAENLSGSVRKMRRKEQRFEVWGGLDPPLLALKVEERGHEPRKVGGF